MCVSVSAWIGEQSVEYVFIIEFYIVSVFIFPILMFSILFLYHHLEILELNPFIKNLYYGFCGGYLICNYLPEIVLIFENEKYFVVVILLFCSMSDPLLQMCGV